MKILTAEQVKEADAYTIKHEPIKSIDLMERAASKCFDWIYEKAPELFSGFTEEREWIFHVVVGPGNNGGDGLVIARMLNKMGYNVHISHVKLSDKGSSDFEANYKKLGKLKKEVLEIKNEDDLIDYPEKAIIVDAIFGTGLNRPPEGIAAKVIEKINQSGATVVSIDLPSGCFSEDNSDNDLRYVVHSDYVLTFQVPKLAFYLAESASITGEVIVLDIGLSNEFLDDLRVSYHLLNDEVVNPMLQKRRVFDHKGTFGHALMIAGSPGKFGAALMAAGAVLKAGAGLVTLHTHEKGAEILHGFLPEAMVSIDKSGKAGFSELPDLKPFGAIGVGPGLGKEEDTAKALKLLIQEAAVPLVLDADALNILSDNPTWLAFLPKGSILTPHPGEFARLIGKKQSHYANLEAQRDLSLKHGIYILLKGGRSSLSLPDGQILINSTGNPGMATGGMGDVLTGIITGLLASGYSSMEAASLGMFIHGRAGDLALENESHESLLPNNLLNYMGRAFDSLNDEN